MENHFSKFSTKSLTESKALIHPAQSLTVRTLRMRLRETIVGISVRIRFRLMVKMRVRVSGKMMMKVMIRLLV